MGSFFVLGGREEGYEVVCCGAGEVKDFCLYAVVFISMEVVGGKEDGEGKGGAYVSCILMPLLNISTLTT